MVTLRIKQHVYFSVRSERLPAEAIAERLGLEPDATRVRGSRVSGPRPVPRSHSWQIHLENDKNGHLDDLIDELLVRLRPVEEPLAKLTRELRTAEGTTALLTIVRYFDAKGGVLDGYQHRLLGLDLQPDVIAFLSRVGAGIWVDEYGADFPLWRPISRWRYSHDR